MTRVTACTDVLIVGAGHSGAQAASALRHWKFSGSITLLGEEPELPYERPPLSKEYLWGKKSFERLLLRPPGFWHERRIQVITGRRVVDVDPSVRVAGTDDGQRLHYERLIWATGGHARRLSCPGGHLAGVHSVRTRADVDRIASELPGVNSIVIIGGGYIGLESAAVFSQMGKQVTLIEVLDRLLARVAGAPLSAFFEAEHRAHGVDVRLSTSVAGLDGQNGHVTGVRLASGEIVPAGLVIVGIGIIPAIEPLLAAGAKGNNGVAVDEYCRTSLPEVFAIGDCALHANPFATGCVRLESVQNANDMALTVAKGITGTPEPYNSVPWFWSNQYDLKLQTIGVSTGHDQTVLRGDPASRCFTLIYLKDGKVIALDCVNSTKDYVQGRSLVLNRSAVDPLLLADVAKPLQLLV